MPLSDLIASPLAACTIREYTPEDLQGCLAVYHSNEPEFYPEGAVAGFTAFLERGTSYFLVVEHEGKIAGCGGLELNGDGPWAWLVNGIIHRDCQRRGLGSALLAARLSLLETEGSPVQVRLRIGTVAAAFYGRYGFDLASVTQNHYGPGLHAGNLVLNVTPEDVEALREALPAKGVDLQINDLPVTEGEEADEGDS